MSQASSATKTFATQTTAGTAQVEKSVGGLGKTLGTLAPVLVGVGAAAVGAIGKGISATQEWASSARTLQRTTGQTAESASGLVAAGALLGVSVDKLSTGFGILSKSIVNSSPALEKYGIDVHDASGELLPFDEILGAVTDKFATLPEGPEQAAFAMNVFGRSGRDLIPILAKGRDGIAELEDKARDLGLVMGQDDLDASKALSAAQRELGLAFKGASISLGKLFIPALTKVTNLGTKAVEFFTNLPAPIREVGVFAAIGAGAIGGLSLAFQGLSSTFSPVIQGIKSIGTALVENNLADTVSSALSATASGVETVANTAVSAGEKAQESADATSSAVEALSGTAAASTLVAETQLAKQEGLFASFGAKISQVVSGLGSSIAAVFTPTGAIVAAVAAAVIALTVVVVKNWDKIKATAASVGAALRPVFSTVAEAFGSLRQSVGDLGSAFGDVFSALGESLRPLLPALTLLGKAFAAIAGGALLVTLNQLAGALKIIAALIDVSAKSTQAFADWIGPKLAAAADFAIDKFNTLVGWVNRVIDFSNRFLGTDFTPIQEFGAAVDAVGTSVDATTQAVDRFEQSGGALNLQLGKSAALFEAMGTSANAFRSQAITAAKQAAEAVRTGAEEGADAFAKFSADAIESATKAWDAFKSKAQDALTFSTSMLGDLTSAAQAAADQLASGTKGLGSSELSRLQDQAHVTASEILQTFRTATDATKSFGRDLLEVSRIGGQAGKDLANALLESGNVMAAQVIADSPGKIQHQIVSAFGKGENAADSLSTKLANAIAGPLENIETLLKRIARHWDVNVNLNDHGAQGKINDIHAGLATLTDKQINVIIHTKAGSPWPDEALDARLFDPLRAAGGQQINGTWTVPLDVAAHTDVAGPTLNPVVSPIERQTGPSATLRTLARQQARILDVQRSQLHVLRDIRGELKGGTGTAAHPASSGTGGGGPDGTSHDRDHVATTALDRSVRSIFDAVSKFATPKEALGVIRRVAQPGLDKAFIDKSVAQIRAELGPKAARRYADALHVLDQRTADNSKHQEDAIKSALRMLQDAHGGTAIQRAVTDAVSTVAKFSTRKEGVGVVRRVAQEGLDKAFIRRSVEQVRGELGVAAARKYAEALHILDVRTAKNSKHQEDAIKAALGMLQHSMDDAARKRKWEPLKDEAWQAYALRNVPRLPEGHTNIDFDHRRRRRGDRITVRLDRRHMDDEMAYEQTYRGF